jgi:hypothetical protein
MIIGTVLLTALGYEPMLSVLQLVCRLQMIGLVKEASNLCHCAAAAVARYSGRVR